MERSQRLWFPEDAFFHEYVNMNETDSRRFLEDKMPAIADRSH
jgi:hypothetical protein